MNPFAAGAALHQATSPGHIASAHRTGEDGARVRMNVSARQDKEKIEKAGKGEAVEERKQSTDFKEAAFCPSAVVQRAARQKMVGVRGVPEITGTFGKANSNFDPI